ncbi:MAG: D-sedoheptulose 7-phosphate isomerase [Candidatus Omnitrophica bacterium]|nr:D-sedoheptulose 7-phosphate isomerase [Candidatus Omnitrophota bacterium]
MLNKLKKICDESNAVKTAAFSENADTIVRVVNAIIKALKAGHKVLFFGNGGSAADSQHLAAELIGRFQKERVAFPSIALTTDTSIITALGNDYGFDVIFERQMEALGNAGDVAVGLSTSGNSENVIRAIKKAKAKGLITVSMTGRDGGKLKSLTDMSIVVRDQNTARVQESHICIGHAICELVESGI